MLFAETTLPDPNNYASIGWVMVVLGVIVVMINQVSEMVARHKAKDPDPPLHKEYVSRAEHDAHVEDVNARFQTLNEDRRLNVIKLHEKIERADHNQRLSNETLRREVKSDIEGVYRSINDVGKEVSKITGTLTALMKNTSNPFQK
jgi:hypothetical protein